jgi:uridine kinase
MDTGTREEMVDHLADVVEGIEPAHPTRVALDGPPAAGKTTLADELAVVLRARGREVIRATIEGFLFPEELRYRRGRYSPEGCYFDNHDYAALNRVLLDPLGPDGDRQFQHTVYDRSTDTAVSAPLRTAAAETILLFDGVFLLRPELIDRWDLRIFVATTFAKTVDRALIREQHARPAAEIERRWRERYIPSQQRYFAAVRPTELAHIVVHNNDLELPTWETHTSRLAKMRIDPTEDDSGDASRND